MRPSTSTEEARAYVEALVRELAIHRPHLLERKAGRFSGPEVYLDRPTGLWYTLGPLRVCVSPWDPVAPNAGRWLHASISHPLRCPSYEELLDVRRRIFRPDEVVLQVFPPSDEHFSLHPYTLHLWATFDGGRPIPDLRGDGGGV